MLDQVVSHCYPDSFNYAGYLVWWGGWKSPVNQLVSIGIWAACQTPSGSLVYYHTTGGTFGSLTHELEVMDLTVKEGWPVSPRLTSAQRQLTKDRACRCLLSYLQELPCA